VGSVGFENIIIPACITVFAFGLLIVSLFSYQKSKNTKLLFVSMVFLILFIRGILLSMVNLQLFSDDVAAILSNPYSGLFDLLILIFLFVATLKR
jgi:hypothetical protein